MSILSKWSFARLGRLVGGIADRAGLTASIESHCQRFACVAANDVIAAERSFADIVQYVAIPGSVSSTLLRIEPQTMSWICGLGSCPGAFAAEVFVPEPARDFNVTLSQVAYYCDRFALTSPIKRGVNEVATGVLADALCKDEGTPAPCGWKIQSCKFGFRLVDHEGTVGFSGKEGEVREKYAEFCDWYETVLLPAILNERVS